MNQDLTNILIVFLAVVAVFVLYKTYVHEDDTFTSSESAMESFNPVVHEQIQSVANDLKSVPNKVRLNKNILEAPQPSNGNFELSNNVMLDNTSFNPKDQLTSEDLLPKDESKWEASNPSGMNHLSDKNFCASGHHYGFNTVGSSLRNPNLQLRSDPVIKQVDVGPWHQSTITADTNRRYFELGEA